MKINTAIVTLITVTAAAAFHSSLRAEQAQGASQSVWDGVYTEEQATRGGALYSQKCAQCHAADLSGGEMAPALASSDFKSNWSGLPVNDLFERIKISMPGDDPGTMSRQETADIVAFMFSRNGFPAGKSELVREAETLKQIMFEATKP
jgi:mono/diheme cytochrome c family protein